MTDVFVAADNIVSPLGADTAENFARLKGGLSGVQQHERPGISNDPFYASLFERSQFSSPTHTKFEQLLRTSLEHALRISGIRPAGTKTLLIVCSTKGNAHLLDEDTHTPPEKISLPASAARLARALQFDTAPIVVSNACISGLLGMITGMRLIRTGRFENVVVTGADVISRFILSGFGSFQALSPGHCKPFDKDRDGINLGEGAATIVLSSRAEYKNGLRLRGGSVSNDANHISGPSRTGRELCQAIERSLLEAGAHKTDIGFISTHGTATAYNDEMEAKAITHAGLNHVPANSLKGYYGHTLGAAGLIESIITLQSIREGMILPSIGYEQNGVSTPLNIATTLLSTPLTTCLKTASGFGGCNAAVVLGK